MFETLLSNNRMKNELSRAVLEKRPLHAYLFCGAKGSGKMTAAKLFAKELVGINKEKVDRDSHPDIFVLEPEKGKKNIPVEAVREMRSDAFVNPSEGDKKIYIVNGMQNLNEAGQNALLTILEQPPSFAVFILLSESKEKVLPTVISRCSVYEMEYVDPKEGAEFLQSKLPSESFEKLFTAMSAASGNIGLAYAMAQSEEFEKSEIICSKIAIAMSTKDEYTLAKILTNMSKDELYDILPVLALYLKDIIVLKTAREGNIVFKQSILQNRTYFDKININILYGSICECEKAIELINGNVSAMLISSVLAVQLCGGK